jgi:hypothetical protein
MARSRKRNPRRSRNQLVAFAALVILAFAAWHYVADVFAPEIVVRVLFSETANCTLRERLLVAGVMRNRIGNPAFGNGATLQAVVQQPGAFSCIGDSENANWGKSRHPDRMAPAERAVWQQCLAIVNGQIPPALGPSGRPLVYYHDKSIGKPASWNNAKWQAVREIVTEHFVFYSIIPTPPARRWFTAPIP